MSNRNHRITFRLNDHENNVLKRRVEMANMSMSEFLRHTALNNKITVIEGLPEFSKELRAIGTNLNQLTRLCNQGRLDYVDLRSTKSKIAEIVDKVSELT